MLYFYALSNIERGDIFYEVFSKHKSKHKIWFLIGMLNVFAETFFQAISEVKALEEKGKVKTEACGSLVIQKLDLVIKSWLGNASNPIQEIDAWHQKANSKKNMGFYVDYFNQSWISPNETSNEEYLESKSYAEKLVSFLEELKKINQTDFNLAMEKLQKV